jgi:hypothetical protein
MGENQDNLETGVSTDPQEAADVTAASGQSDENIETQATEGTETTDVSTETTVETTHPWDSDDRFKGKTPDEMFKIVQEADKYKGQLSQKAKVADLLSQQFGLTPERMAQIAQERAEAQQAAHIQANPIAYVQNELQQVKQQLVIKDEEVKLDKFLAEKPQFADFRNEIKSLGFSVDRDKTWDQIAEKYFGRAIAKGQEAAYNQIDIKQKTQATGVSRGEVRTSLTTEDMSKMSVSELEAILPKANRP